MPSACAAGHRVPHSSSSSTDHGVRREPEKPDNFGCLGAPSTYHGVAIFDQLLQLRPVLDDPGTGAVDDLQAMLLGSPHSVGAGNRRGADDQPLRRDRPRRRCLGCPDPGGRAAHLLFLARLAAVARQRRLPWPCRSPRARCTLALRCGTSSTITAHSAPGALKTRQVARLGVTWQRWWMDCRCLSLGCWAGARRMRPRSTSFLDSTLAPWGNNVRQAEGAGRHGW